MGPAPILSREASMKIHGTTEGNLVAAIRSATRLRNQSVHADTLRFWSDLIRHAQRELSSGFILPSKALKALIAELELEVSRRGQ